MSNLDEGFVCEIFDDQYSHYCRHCGAAQEQEESPATVPAVAAANSAMVPCQHVWVPFIAHPPIEQCTQCDAVRRAQHQ